MENSGIQWTHHTFNPWIGCQRVSPGCTNCYAEALDKRWGGVKLPDGTKSLRWGPTAPRVRTSAANWRLPLKWDKAAEKAGVRHRVFCASLADVFEDRPELSPWRAALFDLIDATPSLDWLLLTKRPENIIRMMGEVAKASLGISSAFEFHAGGVPIPNVWFGTTVEDQQRGDERIPELLKVPARVRFLSCEPLIEAVTLPVFCLCGCGKTVREVLAEPSALNSEQREASMKMGLGVNWVIIGGESGPGARPFAVDWARSLVLQCRESGVAPFVKQLGSVPVSITGATGHFRTHEGRRQVELKAERLRLKDHHGGDMAEWPEDLRVREFPV